MLRAAEGTANLLQKLEQATSTNKVERLGEIYEGCIERSPMISTVDAIFSEPALVLWTNVRHVGG